MNRFLEAWMVSRRSRAIASIVCGLLFLLGLTTARTVSLAQTSSGDPAGIKIDAPAGAPGKPATAAANEIEIGKVFEEAGRLDDAEKAYSKALETATGAEREEARNRLE